MREIMKKVMKKMRGRMKMVMVELELAEDGGKTRFRRVWMV